MSYGSMKVEKELPTQYKTWYEFYQVLVQNKLQDQLLIIIPSSTVNYPTSEDIVKTDRGITLSAEMIVHNLYYSTADIKQKVFEELLAQKSTNIFNNTELHMLLDCIRHTTNVMRGVAGDPLQAIEKLNSLYRKVTNLKHDSNS